MQQQILNLRVIEKNKNINKMTKIKRTNTKNIYIYYKLELKSETKNNETFIRDLMKKIKKNQNNKHQILNIKT
jgi:hypothetical protein